MLSRIITKIFSVIDDLRWKNYYKTCTNRGLKIGKGAVLRNGVDFGSEPFLIEIGENSRVSSNVSFITHSGGQMIMRKVKGYEDVRIFGRIKIGKNTFIGAHSIITHNVHIGDNCIIGAGSLVSSSIPDDTVYGGVPAKFICMVKDYYEKKKNESVIYPRELEANRPKLDAYIKEHLPHTYKPVKKQ